MSQRRAKRKRRERLFADAVPGTCYGCGHARYAHPADGPCTTTMAFTNEDGEVALDSPIKHCLCLGFM